MVKSNHRFSFAVGECARRDERVEWPRAGQILSFSLAARLSRRAIYLLIFIYLFSFWRGGGAELMSRHLSEMCRRRFRRRMQHPYNIYNVFIWRTIASCANQFVYLRDRSVIMLPAIKSCTRAPRQSVIFVGVTRSTGRDIFKIDSRVCNIE